MGKRKISTRLAQTYAILVIVLIGITSVVFYSYNKETIHAEGVGNLSQMTTLTMEQIDNCLTSMEQVTIDVLADGEFAKDWEIYSREPTRELYTEIKKRMISAYKNRSNIRRVAVYDAGGNYVCTGAPEIDSGMVIQRARHLEKTYKLNLTDSRVFLGADRDFWEPSTGSDVITEIKPIKNLTQDIVCYIEIQQNAMYINNICKLSWGTSHINIFVFMGERDDLFYMSEEKKNMDRAAYFRNLTKKYAALQETDHDIVSQAGSNYYSCRTVLVLPKQILYKSMNKILRGIVFVAGLLVIFTVLYSVFMTKRIMRPINCFIKMMQSTELDHFVRPRTVGEDWETGILLDSFAEMADRLQTSISAQRKMEEMQTKTLFSILQSEISPHFLYNTLGSIANLCEKGENAEAADACYSLTEILRYASGYATQEVTLKEELAELRSYLALMKSRYRQRLEYEIQMEPFLENQILPKLTLQPLVENAIKYSLMETECVCVKIYAVYIDGNMILEVKDNGCGFTPETMEKIRRKVEDFKKDRETKEIMENIQFGGMGLSGTLIRLSIFFEDFSYRLINCNDEGGTSIALYMGIEKRGG